LKENNIDTENNYFKFLTSLPFSRARQHTHTHTQNIYTYVRADDVESRNIKTIIFYINTVLFFHKLKLKNDEIE